MVDRFQFVFGMMLTAFLLGGCAHDGAPPPWAAALEPEVQALGYRNWIVLGDQGFPIHSRRGVRTLLIDDEIPEVLHEVLEMLEKEQKVIPRIYVAQELQHVPNDSAPGIDEFRKKLERALHGHPAREMQSRSLSFLLEDSSKSFAVLVLKTDTALPYSSVYIELDSGYWDAESERELRRVIADADTGAS